MKTNYANHMIKELTACANMCGTDKGTAGYTNSMLPNNHYGYTDFYDQYFAGIRERCKIEHRKVRVLEFGVFLGYSLNMYIEYFGKSNVEVVGLDIDDKSMYNNECIKTYVVDQTNVGQLDDFVSKMKAEEQSFDIILDDAIHACGPQLNTLFRFHELVNPEGIYIIEDCHYNYLLNQLNEKHDFGMFMNSSVIIFADTLCKFGWVEDDTYEKFMEHIKDSISFRRKWDGVAANTENPNVRACNTILFTFN